MRRAAQGVDHAGELDQQTIPGRLDDAAAMLGDARIDQLAAQRFQRSERPFLVSADKPRIAGYIARIAANRRSTRSSVLVPPGLGMAPSYAAVHAPLYRRAVSIRCEIHIAIKLLQMGGSVPLCINPDCACTVSGFRPRG
jgi:hypothetical protein